MEYCGLYLDLEGIVIWDELTSITQNSLRVVSVTVNAFWGPFSIKMSQVFDVRSNLANPEVKTETSQMLCCERWSSNL